jgi:hypothetical protein
MKDMVIKSGLNSNTYIVKEKICDIDERIFEGKISKVIKELDLIKRNAEHDGYKNIRIVGEAFYGPISYHLRGDRKETKLEEKKRLQAEVLAIEKALLQAEKTKDKNKKSIKTVEDSIKVHKNKLKRTKHLLRGM